MASFSLSNQESNLRIVQKYYPKPDLRKVSIAFSKGKKLSADYQKKQLLAAEEGKPYYPDNLPH